MVPIVRCSVEPSAEQPQPPRPPSWKAQQLYNLLGSSTDTPVGSERGEVSVCANAILCFAPCKAAQLPPLRWVHFT